MSLLDRIERKFEWLAFPALFKCLTILGALVYGLSWTKPELAQLLDFDKHLILNGQWWRLITFPFAASGAAGHGVFSLVFFIFGILFSLLISDTLEQAWGSVRTTLFLLTGLLGILLGCWICPFIPSFPGTQFYTAVFLAFAYIAPDFIIRIFFIIPVPCHLIAKILLIFMLIQAVISPMIIPFLLLSNVNLFIWVAPTLWRVFRTKGKSAGTRRGFSANSKLSREAFHTCSVCQRTEHTTHLEFRVSPDGIEYCSDHLPEST